MCDLQFRWRKQNTLRPVSQRLSGDICESSLKFLYQWVNHFCVDKAKKSEEVKVDVTGRYVFVPKICVRLLDGCIMRCQNESRWSCNFSPFTQVYWGIWQENWKWKRKVDGDSENERSGCGPSRTDCFLFLALLCPSMGHIVTHTHKITHSVVSQWMEHNSPSYTLF